MACWARDPKESVSDRTNRELNRDGVMLDRDHAVDTVEAEMIRPGRARADWFRPCGARFRMMPAHDCSSLFRLASTRIRDAHI
jgi:hypothetical protein